MRDSLETIIKAIVDERLKEIGVSVEAITPKSLRQSAGYTIEGAAAICGITACQLARIEDAKVIRPKPETLEKIARGLGVDVEKYRKAVAESIARKETQCRTQTTDS